jgi:hypothetical protein
LVEAEERSPTGLGLPRFVREEFERYLALRDPGARLRARPLRRLEELEATGRRLP